MTRLLLTGGCGFIGSHCVEHWLKNSSMEIVVLDRLTYAGNQNFLTRIDIWEREKKRVHFIYHDFRSPLSDVTLSLIGQVDYIVHMGAETHVGNSLTNPLIFAESNVIGTLNMLEATRSLQPKKFIYISTDEVFGPVQKGQLHVETALYKPSNPYAATKAGAESLCHAWWKSFGVPVFVTHTMNNFGERQHIEKFIPQTMYKIMHDQPVPLHCRWNKDTGSGLPQDVSSRCWLHARNHADALLFLLDKGQPGEHYNIVGEWADVRMMAEKIANILGKSFQPEYIDFHSFHPGHDMHYGLDGTKLANMGWKPPQDLDSSLEKTVRWTLAHPEWFGKE